MEIIEYKNLNSRFTGNQILEFINTCMYEFLNRPFKELKDINKPIGISEYELIKSIPENLKSNLPTVEEIENEIEEKLK